MSGLLWLIGFLVFFILAHNLEAERGSRREDPVNNKSPNINFPPHQGRNGKWRLWAFMVDRVWALMVDWFNGLNPS